MFARCQIIYVLAPSFHKLMLFVVVEIPIFKKIKKVIQTFEPEKSDYKKSITNE